MARMYTPVENIINKVLNTYISLHEDVGTILKKFLFSSEAMTEAELKKLNDEEFVVHNKGAKKPISLQSILKRHGLFEHLEILERLQRNMPSSLEDTEIEKRVFKRVVLFNTSNLKTLLQNPIELKKLYRDNLKFSNKIT